MTAITISITTEQRAEIDAACRATARGGEPRSASSVVREALRVALPAMLASAHATPTRGT